MSSYITSLGTATPPYRFTQQEVADYLSQNQEHDSVSPRKIKWLFRHTGIEHRYSVLPDFSPNGHEPRLYTSSTPTTQSRMKQYHQHALPLAKEAVDNC
jgi:predicted naringenin-chalcone synthase